MQRAISKFSSLLGIVATIQVSFLDLAFAQNNLDASTAAGFANSSTFKPNTSDLYGSNNGNVEIIGVSPGNAPLSMSPSSLYFGVTGQSADQGSLPSISTYEELYGHRDQQLGNLESGTGAFSSTGAVNAEAAAFEVLRRSSNLPSMSRDAFLDRTREILGANDDLGMGQCIIEQVTGSQEFQFDNSFTETCETLNLNTQPMVATRAYNGPSRIFSHYVSNGQNYCTDGGRSIAVDRAETCGTLSILQSIPEPTGTGQISARACGGNTSCVELYVAVHNQIEAGGINFTVTPSINLTRAYASFDSQGYTINHLQYQGGGINIPSWGTDINEIRTTKGQIQRFSFRMGTSGWVREPASGWYNDQNAGFYVTRARELRSMHWGWTVIWSRSGAGTLPDYVDYNGCRYYPEYATRLGKYGIARECLQNIAGSGNLTVRLEFQTQDFSAWAYNQTRWDELQTFVADGACTLTASVTSTVRKSNGCVNSFTSSAGRPGELCGPDIPADPFSALLADRAATQISIAPQCQFMGSSVDGDQAFTENNTCSRLENDSTCQFIGRECTETLSNGQCLVYESRYTCGETLSYTSPIVTEINICDSSLSCMGGSCLPNTGTDGTASLADAASKLAAVDMILSDMQCERDPASPTSAPDINSCQLFGGDAQNCSKVTLGLSNCCSNAKGVNLADYLKLAFAVSRVSRVVEGTALANPITSAWTSFENYGRQSFSALTRPITESWESIIGNSGVTKGGANALSIEAVKQGMMKNVAQWTSNIFGEQAANALFQVGGGPAIAGGSLQTGTIGLTSGAASVMSAVMTAYTVYALASVLIEILFSCSAGEQELQVRKALRSTHEVGTFCSSKILGKCVKKKTGFCMFSSPLSRILNEQARHQLNIPWGPPENPDCRGITLAEFQTLDMDRVDLSEWTGMLAASGMLDVSSLSNIDNLTGNASTLGRAQADLYPRENAIDRNSNRFDNIDLDALRNDAVNDFGMGVVQ